MYGEFEKHVERELAAIREAGFYKDERVIATPQRSVAREQIVLRRLS